MRIIVYGLGIIGGSVAASLKRAGHEVYAMNRSRAPLEFALAHGYIDGEATSFEGADAIFLALPPRVTLRLLAEGNFPENSVVSDICGVKGELERTVLAAPRRYRYVGIHPMAGKETTGIRSASPALFDGKNLILVKNGSTDPEAFALVRRLGEDMRFGRFVVCSAAEHDRLIALTSQLAHIVSNAYIKTPEAGNCLGFTGGSFQDMTRIASLDENVWTELFFLNREALVGELARLETALSAYRSALLAGDEESMRELLREGKRYHGEFLSKNAGEF